MKRNDKWILAAAGGALVLVIASGSKAGKFGKVSALPPEPLPPPLPPSPTPPAPAVPPTSPPAASVAAWAPASERMYMQHGRAYEMRPDSSGSQPTLELAHEEAKKRLPITVLAEVKSNALLGLAYGVTLLRFRWDGQEGIADFPGWVVRGAEIRPYTGETAGLGPKGWRGPWQ